MERERQRETHNSVLSPSIWQEDRLKLWFLGKVEVACFLFLPRVLGAGSPQEKAQWPLVEAGGEEASGLFIFGITTLFFVWGRCRW